MPLLAAVTFGVIEAISELRGAGPGIRATRYERRDNIYLRQRRVMSVDLLTQFLYSYAYKYTIYVHRNLVQFLISISLCYYRKLFLALWLARPYLSLIWVIFQTSGSKVTLAPPSGVVGALASAMLARLHQASPTNPPLWSADQCWWRGQGTAPALVPAHPATSKRARPSRHDGAGRSGRSGAPAQQCLHTHLARARTQITLIHFKPTLSPAALQQILLKPCLHNRQSRPAAALQ